MYTIRNLTKEVVLLRFNSGAEVNVPPEGQLKVADSEVRLNRDIEKLEKLGVLRRIESVAADSGAADADETDVDDTYEGDADEAHEPHEGQGDRRATDRRRDRRGRK